MHKLISTLSLCFIPLLALSLPVTPPAAQLKKPALLAYTEAPTPIRIITGDHFAPYASTEMTEHGIASQIVRTILKQQFPNQEILMDIKPWKRVYMSAKNAEYLGAFPYAKTHKRHNDFLFSQALMTTKVAFFVRKDSTRLYQTENDFIGARICRPLGYHTQGIEQWIKPNIAKLIQPTNLENCFSMLKSNRVDLVPVDQRVGNFLIEKNPNFSHRDIKELDQVISVDAIHFIISRTYPNADKELARFNELLEQYKRTPEYLEIIQ